MKITLIVGSAILLVFGVFFALPWIILYVGYQFTPNPPTPSIVYGEFPFRLEYQIEDETKTIVDTLICEYDGIGINENTGKHRKWRTTLLSGNKNVVLLKIDDNTEVRYAPGEAEYYMGDMKEGINFRHHFPNAIVVNYGTRLIHSQYISADELLSIYHIKLICWEPSNPITNSFE